MPNHSREEMERNAKVGKGILITALGSLAGYAIKKVNENNVKRRNTINAFSNAMELSNDRIRLDEMRKEVEAYQGDESKTDDIIRLTNEVKAIKEKWERFLK